MNYFACGGSDGTINVWHIPKGNEHYPLMPPRASRQRRETIFRAQHPHFQSANIHAEHIDW
jgi:hypothetical protein